MKSSAEPRAVSGKQKRGFGRCFFLAYSSRLTAYGLFSERPLLDVPPDVLVRPRQDALELLVDAEDLIVRPPEERRHILIQNRRGLVINLGSRRNVRGAASFNQELIEIRIRVVRRVSAGRGEIGR